MARFPASPLLDDHLDRYSGGFSIIALASLTDYIPIALVCVGRDLSEPESRRIAFWNAHGIGRSHIEPVQCWNVDGVDSCNNRLTEAWGFGISV